MWGLAVAFVALLAFVYVLWLLRHARERAGRVAVVALWLVAALAAFVLAPPFLLYVLIHAGLIWLIRSLYYYSGVVPTLLDLALSGFGVAFALGTVHRTGSVVLGLWAFFLVQAVFVAIPATLRKRRDTNVRSDSDFDRHRRQAEAALQQLIAR